MERTTNRERVRERPTHTDGENEIKGESESKREAMATKGKRHT